MSTSPHESIQHQGVVIKTGAKEIEVMILSQSACAACHAKGACTMADMKEKIVKVTPPHAESFAIGQQVVLEMKQAMGVRAVIFGYILPFIVMVVTLIVMLSAGFSEGRSGVVALCVLVLYFVLIYLFRKKLDQTFVFSLSENQSAAEATAETSSF